MVRREDLLRGMVGLALAPRAGTSWREEQRRLARVQVDAARIIRTVVGLHPIERRFVVRTDSLGAKKVVHNYGHGGTSQLAVEQAWATGARDFAVLGCGAVGLASARLLQNRGGNFTIYARELPPQTTSNMAPAVTTCSP